MQTQNEDGRAIFWGIIAAGSVAVGILVAIFAGYLLGHFTHQRTKTVVAEMSRSQVSDDSQNRAPAASAPAMPGVTAALLKGTPALGSIGQGLSGPKNLRAWLWAEGPKNVEALAPAPGGGVFASTAAESPGPQTIYLVKPGAKPVAVIRNLPAAVGLSWTANQLYVSSVGSVDVYSDFNGSSFGAHHRILSNLPAGKLGFNGSIISGPDGRMYMAIGSPCDACRPQDHRSATIVSFNRDGSDVRTFASGFRGNAFLAWAPGTMDLFAASNASNAEPQQPDELDLVRPGDDWGYPECHRQGGPACDGVPPRLATLDVHAAANGLTFVTGAWGQVDGLSAIVTEWTLGKVIQSAIVKRGATFTARPRVALTGFKNPSAVMLLADRKTVLVADYGTGKLYAVAPGTPSPAGATPSSQTATGSASPPSGADSTLKLAAEATGKLMFTTTSLAAKAGNVRLDFVNRSPVPHNFAIERGGNEIATTKTITRGEDKSTVIKLAKGTYTFLCTIPGHAQAGMRGKLVVS